MNSFGRKQQKGSQGSAAQGNVQNQQNPYQAYQQNSWQGQRTGQPAPQAYPVQGQAGGVNPAANQQAGGNAGVNPYARQNASANPYAQQGAAYAQQGMAGNPYAQQGMAGNPYAQQGTAYARQGMAGNPYAQQGAAGNAYPRQPGQGMAGNPYAQQASSYARQNPVQPLGNGQAPYPPQNMNAVPPQAGAYGQQANPYARQGGYVQGQGQPSPVYPPQPVPGMGFPQSQVGYQAQNGKNRNKMILEQVLNILLPAGTVVFLVLSLMQPGIPLFRFLVLGFGALSLIWLWMQQAFSRNTRILVSALLAACMLVSVLGMVLPSGGDPTRVSDGGSPASQQASGGGESAVQPVETTPLPETPAPAPTEEVDNSTVQMQESIQSFLYFWEANNIDSMLNYCAPSWRRSFGDDVQARTELFRILANRRPLEYTFGNVSGTVNDSSRNVEVTIRVDKQTGKDPETYLFRIIMLNEDGTWYVDPKSLSSHEEAEATTFSAEITQPPTPQPAAADQVLYYNPDGGSYYHADPECALVGEKYRPLKGSFTYSHISDDAFKSLLPCSGCAAPLRPKQ